MRRYYLEEIGIKKSEYDFPSRIKKHDPKRYEDLKKERKKYGFSSDECYNLDETFFYFAYERLVVLKEDSSGVIDWEVHDDIPFHDEKINMKEAIDIMIEGFKIACITDCWDLCKENEESKKVNDALDLWRDTIFYLWW